jgi:hypothetical protein
MREHETRTAVRDVVYNHDAMGTSIVSRSDCAETLLTCQDGGVSATPLISPEQTCCIPLKMTRLEH